MKKSHRQGYGKNELKWVAVIAVVVLAGFAWNAYTTRDGGLADNQARVSRADMGAEWPLTVDSGVLQCDGSNGVGKVLFLSDDGGTYSVNGLAQGDKQYEPIDALWADSDAGTNLKKPMAPLIDRGLALCG